MKTLIFKAGVCLAAVVLLAQTADAQRSGRRRTTSSNNNNNAGNTNQPVDTLGKNQQNNNNVAPVYNPYGNIPIEVDSSGILDNEVKKSLRQDNAYDKSSLTKRNPLPYEYLRWDDALYAEKVWR